MLKLLREIQSIAQTGLFYTKDEYDHERYQRLREIAYELISKVSNSDIADVEKFFLPEDGYATPKVDLRACVINENKVLLVKERSDGKWTLPGGWADQNESPIEGIIREVKEESGYDIKIQSLYSVRDRDRHKYTPKYPVSLYKLFFTACLKGGDPLENTEISDIGFFTMDQLPPLSEERVLREDIQQGFEHFNSKSLEVHVD